MATPPKGPPRFVPTLTEVVQVPGTPPASKPVEPRARTTVMPPPHTPAPAGVVRQPGGVSLPAMPRHGSAPVAATAGGLSGVRIHASGAQVPGNPPHPPHPPGIQARAPDTTPPPVAAVAARPMPEGMEEYMVHRVMQRVDVVLDQRLREAIATVVQEQTRSVLPRLREEIESVVRHAVYEAVAEELASGAPKAGKG